MNDEIDNLLGNIDTSARVVDIYKYGLPVAAMPDMRRDVRIFYAEVVMDIELYLSDKMDAGKIEGWLNQYKIDRGL